VAYQLVESGLVHDFADLYELTVDQLIELDRMGRKSAEKLVKNIDESKSRGLARLLNALCIRHVGARVAATLAEHFGSMDELLATSEEGLSNVEEVGPVIAHSVHSFLSSAQGKQAVQKLVAAGLDMTAPKRVATSTASGPLAGMSVVVTGTLSKYKREEIEALIEQLGGRAAASVTKKTDFLVAGEKAGSKLAKAEKLGVRVISEPEFDQLVGRG
jgi:DNA ligase (NAD+)